MKFLSRQWTPELTDPNKATWDTLAAAMAASPFNAFVKENLRRWTQFTAPSKVSPVVPAGTQPTFTSLPASVGAVGQATITWDLNALNNAWGLLIFRSLTGGFTPGRNTLIGVALLKILTADTFIDTPVEAGSYFYNYQAFTDTGSLGTALGQTTATVT